MDTSKPWYQSTGIWGSLVSIAALVLGMFHIVSLSAEQQTAIVTDLVTVATAIVTVVGVVMAFIGRLKATQTIGKVKPE